MCEKLYSQSYGKNEELWNAPKYSLNDIVNTMEECSLHFDRKKFENDLSKTVKAVGTGYTLISAVGLYEAQVFMHGVTSTNVDKYKTKYTEAKDTLNTIGRLVNTLDK